MTRRSWLAALLLTILVGCDHNSTEDTSAMAEPSASARPTSAASSPSPSTSPVASSPTPTPDRTQTATVYFSDVGAAMNCTQVQPVERQVPETDAVATAALQELFDGTTEAERSRGLSSLFDATSERLLRSVRVEAGTAYVDLAAPVLNINNVTTTCGRASFFSTVEATVEQFPTVDDTRFAVEGDPRKFYEHMGIGCAGAEQDRCDPEPFERTG